MPLVNFPRSATITVAFVCTLSACGGGGGGGDDKAASNNDSASGASNMASSADTNSSISTGNTSERLEAEATVANIAAETVTVSLVGSGPQISTSPVLTLANGTAVTRLEDVPEGIANSTWKARTGTRLPLKIVLKNGTYRLNKTWTWTPAASGRADSPVIITAENPGQAIITGSISSTIPQATGSAQSPVQVNLNGLVESTFEQLWANGRRTVRARSPNAGSFYFVKGTTPSWSGSTTLNDLPVDTQAFRSESAVTSLWNTAGTTERANAVLVAMHSWTTSHHRINAVDANNQVLLSPASRWAFLSKGNYQRYFVENIPSALDAPSEWYFNPQIKRLSYIPTVNENGSSITFEIPVLSTLLEIKGQASANKWVEYVQFSGLSFRYAGYALPAQGLIDQQAAIDVSAAVVMNAARNITLSNCNVSRVGGYAVWLRDGVQNTTVQNCEIYDAGAGGVRIGMTYQSSNTSTTGSNLVQSNRIHSIGHQFPGAVGVWIGQSGNNTVESNLIGDTTYSGISAGWSWGYGISFARNNKITRNFLYDIMQGSLSDGGAIYTLGVSPGTEIKGNVIRGVQAYNYYGAGGWGIYNDEGSSNITVDSNIVLDSSNGGYMLHYGANNAVSNNVFAGGSSAEIQVGRTETQPQAALDDNRIIPTLQSFIAYPAASTVPSLAYRNNRVSRQYANLSTVPAACGTGCTLTDSMTVTKGEKLDVPKVYEGDNQVTLPSPVSSSWVGASLVSVESPSKLWSKGRGFNFDATQATLGSRPMGFIAIPANKPELISVAQNAAGDRCLAFQDNANLTNRWEPFGFLEADYATGTTSITFTIKADAATEFIHEWRDPSTATYLTGPSVTLSGSRGVVVGGQVLAPLPVGQWVKVTITSAQTTATRWSLKLKYSDGTERTFTDLRPLSDAWSRTRAFYFISNASTASTPCIGKWTIENQ